MPDVKIEVTNPETDEPIMQFTAKGFESAAEQLGKMERRWNVLLDEQEAAEEHMREELEKSYGDDYPLGGLIERVDIERDKKLTE